MFRSIHTTPFEELVSVLPNPYSPGAVPDYLAGRGTELEVIRERLARLRMLGRSGGPLLAFYGSRGYGKTSLLRAAQREALSNGFLTVWVTGRGDADLAPELARNLGVEIQRGAFGERAKTILDSLDKIKVEVGVPGAKVGAELTPGNESAAIERSLHDAGRFARDHDHHGLAVFVDEFHEARLGDRRSLLIALQHFDGAPEGCPVALIAAGLPSLLAAVPAAATFGERTDFYEIGPLNAVAVAEALRLPAEQLGVTWDDDALLAAIDDVAGYPHHAQLLGYETWQAARPESSQAITAGHVRIGTEAAAARMVSIFRSRVSKLGPELRRLANAMADLGDGPAARLDLANSLGVTTDALSRPRQDLIDRGLIESAGHGLLQFTIPGFAAYLRARSQDEGA